MAKENKQEILFNCIDNFCHDLWKCLVEKCGYNKKAVERTAK